MNTITYKIIDLKTGWQVGKDYTHSNRNRARNKAEKLNLEHGCHRYYAKAIIEGIKG